jgi:hypothetical protein
MHIAAAAPTGLPRPVQLTIEKARAVAFKDTEAWLIKFEGVDTREQVGRPGPGPGPRPPAPSPPCLPVPRLSPARGAAAP